MRSKNRCHIDLRSIYGLVISTFTHEVTLRRPYASAARLFPHFPTKRMSYNVSTHPPPHYVSPQRGELICLYGVCANFVVKHRGRPDVLTTIVVTYDMCVCMYRTYAVLRSPHMVYVCDRVVAKSDVLDNYRCQIRFIFVHFEQFRCCLPFSSQVVATEFQLIYRVVFKVAQLMSPVCFNFVVSHN